MYFIITVLITSLYQPIISFSLVCVDLHYIFCGLSIYVEDKNNQYLQKWYSIARHQKSEPT